MNERDLEPRTTGEGTGTQPRYKRVIGAYSRGLPGPICFVTGGLHGNEPAGVLAMERVLAAMREHQMPLRGQVVAVSGNLRALARRQRFIESDLNRIWREDVFDRIRSQGPEADAPEENELREVLEVFDDHAGEPHLGVIFLDLHTTSAGGAPFQCMGDTLQNRKIAYEIPIPLILGLEEVIHGSLLEFVGERGHVAIAIEAGQHDDPVTVEHHEAAVWQALVAAEMLSADDVPEYERHRARLIGASRGVPHVVEVKHRHGLTPGDGFRMRPGYCNFHPVKKGELLATDNSGEIRAPNDCLLLLPSYQGQGDDGFFLGQQVRPIWLRVSAFLRRARLGRLLVLLPGIRRDDPSRNRLIVNRHIARFWPVEIFHLFGYRRCEDFGKYLTFTRRREFPGEDTKGSKFLGLWVLFVLALLVGSCDAAPRTPPSVVMIVLDALHAGHLSHLGYERETSPNIDALAAEGATFVWSFAPTPYTLASIPSLLTGRHPDTHGLSRPGSALPSEEVTLAEHLAAAGYRTYAAVANLQGSSLHALDQGFEVYEELFKRGAELEGDSIHIPSADEFLPVLERWTSELGDRPVFYYLHLLEPHIPYDPPEGYRELWLDPGYDGRYREGVTPEVMKRAAAQNTWKVEPVHREPIRALYDANIRWADENVGELLDHLREVGLYDRALVVLTSDHGEALWQHGRWGHSTQVYDEMTRIPLVIKPPAGSGAVGLRVEALASLMDVVPTVCDLLGLEPPDAPLDGRSLAPALEDPAGFARRTRDRELVLRTNHVVPELGLRAPERKTVLVRRQDDAARVRVEHYSLERDPGEQSDLGEVRIALRDAEVLEAWAAGARLAPPASDRELTDEESAHLGDLGYGGE